jgi:hypothetical protein
MARAAPGDHKPLVGVAHAAHFWVVSMGVETANNFLYQKGTNQASPMTLQI